MYAMYGHCRRLRIKMKVKLLTYICSGDTPAEAFHTAAFNKKIDSLFTFSIAVICLTRSFSNVH